MKLLGLLIFLPLAVWSETHAVLNDDRTLIVGYEEHDAGLISTYRADPNKANKVAHLRLLVIPEKPQATLQQVVEPEGTNINDGGYELSESSVTQVWNLRSLTAQEIASSNAATASAVSLDLSQRIRTGHWESPTATARIDDLQSVILDLIAKALVRAGMATQLTVPERQRFNSVSNELADLHALVRYGRTNYFFVSTNSAVVTAPTNWPNRAVDEVGE